MFYGSLDSIPARPFLIGCSKNTSLMIFLLCITLATSHTRNKRGQALYCCVITRQIDHAYRLAMISYCWRKRCSLSPFKILLIMPDKNKGIFRLSIYRPTGLIDQYLLWIYSISVWKSTMSDQKKDVQLLF